jgi:hypothetical protein
MSYFLLTFNLGYLSQHVGTILQIFKIEKKKSTEGVCLDTQILFLFGVIARIFWIRETLLNHMITYCELFIAFVSLVCTIYLCLFKYNNFYTVFENLNNKRLPFYARWYFITAISVVLGLIFFPGNENGSYEFDSQTLISFNIFVESSGLLPQIIMVRREKDSTGFSRSYIMFIIISRLLRMLFWIELWFLSTSFIYLLIADLVNLILVFGFSYTFLQNFNRLNLPTADSKKPF